MNTLLINKFFWPKGGSEAVFFGEMELLRSHGHNVIPFSMQDKNNISSPYSKYFVSHINYDNASLYQKLVAAGRIIYSFEARNNIRKLLSHETVDIAHFHIFQHQISPSVFGPLREKNIPIILTLHDLKPMCPSYLMYTKDDVCTKCKGKRFYNCAINKCTKNSFTKSLINTIEMYFHYLMKYYESVDLYISPSKFVKQKMIEFGFSEEKIIHLPNFIDTERFTYNRSDDGYGIYFGRLSSEKGLASLLDACSMVPNIPIKIVGTGPQEKELLLKSKSLNLDNVEFLGFKSGAELTNLLSNASFSILPSICYENCPMSILESFSMGTPVIGSRIGGIPELICDGVDGYTFEKGNAEDLARIMTLIWSDKDKRLDFGAAGRKKIESNHLPNQHYGQLIQLYTNLL